MSSTACRALLVSISVSILIAAAGCGGSDKGAAASPASGESRAGDQPSAEEPGESGESGEEAEDGLEVSGTKGTLEAQQIQAGVGRHASELQACYQAQLSQKKFLSGKLTVEVLVEKSGQVGRARMLDSDVGDWAVERCVLGVARRMTFPSPKGGDGQALFRVPLNFTGARTPVEGWPEERIAAAVGDKRAELDSCAGDGDAPAGVIVTLYVGNRGVVKAVGFASADQPIADAWADCAARAVAAWTLPDPQGKIGKASFRYPPEAP